VPRKALIGPWEHNFPNNAVIGPAIDYPTEALRWWDHWLKGIETGIMKEPMYRAWMPTDTAHNGTTDLPGRWVAEEKWPSPRIQLDTWHLNRGTLDANGADTTELVLFPHQAVGETSGHWCPGGGGPVAGQVPLDQREDDAYSLVFDSAPLQEPIEILGFPLVELDVSVDQPVALLAVRLNEVRPDGTSRRVSYGVLNLTHRDGHEHPQPLDPGKRYRIKMQLKNTAFSFQSGNRLRVSISAAYWYLVWPSPRAVTLSLFTGGSTLLLPARRPQPLDEELHPFGAPVRMPTKPQKASNPLPGSPKKFEWDVGTSTFTVTSEGGGTRRVAATGTVLTSKWMEVSKISDNDPTSATLTSSHTQEFRRGDWQARIESSFHVSVDEQNYRLKGTITTYDQDRLFFTRSWDERIPRILA
jgi:predicted acyl esterase